MRIAQLAPLWKTVPPQKYGGSELVVANLSDALTDAGHDVTVFGCGGSQVKGAFVEVIDRPMYDILGGFSWGAIQSYEFLLYDELFKRLDDFDVVHNHTGFHTVVFDKLLPQPMVTTIHSSLPPDFPALAEQFRGGNYVSISNAQREITPYLNYVATVYHGIETKKFTPSYEAGEYFCFVGTMSENKGIDRAVRAAHELHERLLIAGEIRDSDRAFLEAEVTPMVDNDRIRFLGEISFEEKVRLYAGAKALLFPIRWSEAFGLVAPEAMACGTPVIAYPNGSLPELIANGETGFLVNSVEELKDRMQLIEKISREHCRAVAVERFDSAAMAQAYVDVYTKLIEGRL
jgi:glycosyltransferase involved in cell wall biosynthesis